MILHVYSSLDVPKICPPMRTWSDPSVSTSARSRSCCIRASLASSLPNTPLRALVPYGRGVTSQMEPCKVLKLGARSSALTSNKHFC